VTWCDKTAFHRTHLSVSLSPSSSSSVVTFFDENNGTVTMGNKPGSMAGLKSLKEKDIRKRYEFGGT
jgi:hypothetical protein